MENLTLRALDQRHFENQIAFMFRKFIEEYGLTAGDDLISSLQNESLSIADLWGVDFGQEVQGAN